MTEEFRLVSGNRKIHGKMMAAKMLPFTDSPEQAQQLLQELLSQRSQPLAPAQPASVYSLVTIADGLFFSYLLSRQVPPGRRERQGPRAPPPGGNRVWTGTGIN
jgi:hypothetical protein